LLLYPSLAHLGKSTFSPFQQSRSVFLHSPQGLVYFQIGTPNDPTTPAGISLRRSCVASPAPSTSPTFRALQHTEGDLAASRSEVYQLRSRYIVQPHLPPAQPVQPPTTGARETALRIALKDQQRTTPLRIVSYIFAS
jgi:hypothetical protein